MNRNTKLENRLIKNIAKNSLNISSLVCLFLFEFGEISVEAFFPKNYSFAKPWRGFFNKYHFEVPSRRNAKENLKRLIKDGIVEERNDVLQISRYGKIIISLAMQKRKILSKKWDGKYRLVIFDIPEIKKAARQWLRGELYLLDYAPLQKSVFIGKYPLSSDIVKKIKAFKLQNHVNYLLVERVYDQRRMKIVSP